MDLRLLAHIVGLGHDETAGERPDSPSLWLVLRLLAAVWQMHLVGFQEEVTLLAHHLVSVEGQKGSYLRRFHYRCVLDRPLLAGGHRARLRASLGAGRRRRYRISENETGRPPINGARSAHLRIHLVFTLRCVEIVPRQLARSNLVSVLLNLETLR